MPPKTAKTKAPAGKVSVRIRKGSKTDDYYGDSVTSIVRREFGRSKHLRVIPSNDPGSPDYAIIAKWDPEYSAYHMLGTVYSVEMHGRSLSKREAKGMINKAKEDLMEPKTSSRKRSSSAGGKR